MILYAKFEDFNISYEPIMKKYFITSKRDGQPEIGGFEFASDAIIFADTRVSKAKVNSMIKA